MVTIKCMLSGGIGNQMYYYAALKAISRLFYGSEILLDLSYFLNYCGATNVTPRQFALDSFCLSTNVRVYSQSEFIHINLSYPPLDVSTIYPLRDTLIKNFKPKPQILELLPEMLMTSI